MDNCYSLEKKIKYICNCNYDFFLNKENVQGIALGYKIKNGFNTCKKCITVFVCRKISKNKLSSKNLIPSFFKGIATDIIESGFFKESSLRSRIRPVKGGYSISTNLSIINGTAGCLVTDGKNKFVLSSNHILSNLNSLPLGTQIVQPGYLYNGRIPADTIGSLYKFIPLRFIEGGNRPTNLSDCALGLLTTPNILSPEIALIGKINCVKNPRLNEQVKKVGSTTELTEGTITNLAGTFIITYLTGQRCLFKDVIATTLMSDDGDSGSLLINKNMCALGLLFSKSDNITLYSRLNTILDQLGVKLVV